MLKIVVLFPIIVLSAALLSCGIELERDTGTEDEITPARISTEDLLDTWILWTVDDETPTVDLVKGQNFREGSLTTLVFLDKDRYTLTIDYSLGTERIADGYVFIVWRAEGTYSLSAGTLTFLTVKWDVGVRSLGLRGDNKALAESLKEEFNAFGAGAIHDLAWPFDNQTGLLMTKQGTGTKYFFKRETALFEEGYWTDEREYFYGFDE